MTEPSKLDLTFERVLCDRHGEPLRARRPNGYPLFVVQAMAALSDDPTMQGDMIRLIGSDPAETMGNVLDEKPLCCRP